MSTSSQSISGSTITSTFQSFMSAHPVLECSPLPSNVQWLFPCGEQASEVMNEQLTTRNPPSSIHVHTPVNRDTGIHLQSPVSIPLIACLRVIIGEFWESMVPIHKSLIPVTVWGGNYGDFSIWAVFCAECGGFVMWVLHRIKMVYVSRFNRSLRLQRSFCALCLCILSRKKCKPGEKK